MPFERHEPDDSQLRPLQEWLLAQLVEAHLSQPAQKRHPFRRFTILGGPHVIHHAGFSSLHSAPLAFDHYEQTKARGGEPVLRVDQEVCRYLDAQVFRQQCTAAYDKWVDANRQLWSARVERDLAGIGHLCREAMQSFATCMVERFEPLNVDTNQQHDVSRLLAVLRHRCVSSLGPRRSRFLTRWWRIGAPSATSRNARSMAVIASRAAYARGRTTARVSDRCGDVRSAPQPDPQHYMIQSNESVRSTCPNPATHQMHTR